MVDVTPETASGFQYPEKTSPDGPTTSQHFQTIATRAPCGASRIPAFPGGILPITHHDHGSSYLWKCFELLDLQLQQQHLITRNRDETTRSRGLGTCAPLWQRLRACCPRTVFYNGPILDGAGNQCQTDLDLSAAMLATRKFWFQPPVKYDPEWTDYLEQYKAQAQTWPHVPPPRTDDLVKTVLATNDSAPGPDGIPYAAWRLHPGTSSEAMATHLNDICRSAVPPRVQFKHGSRKPKWVPPLIISVH